LVDLGDDSIQATVEDNGSGFNVSEVINNTQPKGIGLTTLRERVMMLGGEIRIDSTVGRGTKVSLSMPI
jgi:two-component system sensor histidine kinase DegS